MINLSPSAEQHIKKIMADEQSLFFKISLSPKGCSGFAYVMTTDKDVGEDWVVSRCGDVNIAVPVKDAVRLGDIKLDWVREGMFSRLEVQNPQVVNACGCGSSFMFKP